METESQHPSAEDLLSLAKYVMELLSPSHKLATHNLEEIKTAFKHDFRSKRTRLKCVSVPQQLVRSLIPKQALNDAMTDLESCAVVGSKAAVTLGIPVGGFCWAFVSKCFCPAFSERACGPRCKAPGQNRKLYAILVTSNRRVQPHEVLMNETMRHNIKTNLFGSSSPSDKNIILNIERCEQTVRDSKFAPKYSTKAVVSWVEQPQAPDETMLAPCLSGFFQSPRHLHKGDLFRICVAEHAPEVLLRPAMFDVQDLYLQVKSVDGPPYEKCRNIGEGIGFLVVKGETTLVQDMNVQSFLPTISFTSNSTIDSFMPNYPEGLSKAYTKFLNAVTPFLRNCSSGLRPAFLITGPDGCGKHFLVSSAAAQLGMHYWSVDCAEIRGSTSGQTVGKLKAVFSKAKQYAPCTLLLSSIEILGRDQDGLEDHRVMEEFEEQLSSMKLSKFPIVVVGTVTSSTDLSGSFARMFLLEIPVSELDKVDRKLQLKQFLCQHKAVSSDECLEEIASRCSGFLLGDLSELVALAIRKNLSETLKLDASSSMCHQGSLWLTSQNFSDALDAMQSSYAGCIGAPKIPSVLWKDVGGLEDVKKEILQTVTMPLKHPELTAGGLARSGILLYGPPGTGKTLLAKAVATECNLNFLSVKGPELLNMYVGQSEANVREVFDRARGASPCIIFFDELDALAPNRGRSGDSGGVMDRVVAQLSSEMDGLQKSALLFVIGATNRPDLIDPALLRPGRFDKLLYVGAYDDPESKFSVLSALTRKFKLNPEVDMREVSSKLPSEVTGADMYAVCSGAWLAAVRRIITQDKNGYPKDKTDVEVNQEDFNQAISKMVPSVSAEDMVYFKGLQKQMSVVKKMPSRS